MRSDQEGDGGAGTDTTRRYCGARPRRDVGGSAMTDNALIAVHARTARRPTCELKQGRDIDNTLSVAFCSDDAFLRKVPVGAAAVITDFVPLNTLKMKLLTFQIIVDSKIATYR